MKRLVETEISVTDAPSFSSLTAKSKRERRNIESVMRDEAKRLYLAYGRNSSVYYVQNPALMSYQVWLSGEKGRENPMPTIKRMLPRKLDRKKPVTGSAMKDDWFS